MRMEKPPGSFLQSICRIVEPARNTSGRPAIFLLPILVGVQALCNFVSSLFVLCQCDRVAGRRQDLVLVGMNGEIGGLKRRILVFHRISPLRSINVPERIEFRLSSSAQALWNQRRIDTFAMHDPLLPGERLHPC